MSLSAGIDSASTVTYTFIKERQSGRHPTFNYCNYCQCRVWGGGWRGGKESAARGWRRGLLALSPNWSIWWRYSCTPPQFPSTCTLPLFNFITCNTTYRVSIAIIAVEFQRKYPFLGHQSPKNGIKMSVCIILIYVAVISVVCAQG